MARHEKPVTITAEGRDKGKVFHITERDADFVEEWCFRLVTAVGRGRPDMEEAAAFPSSAVMAMGAVRMLVSMPFDDAKPLIDDMMACVQCVPDPSKPIVRRPLVSSDTEEVATRLFLRKEVLELHMGFTIDEIRSKLAAWIQGVVSSLRTPTSEPLSDLSSAAD